MGCMEGFPHVMLDYEYERRAGAGGERLVLQALLRGLGSEW
jgi:hypothetical protein